MEKIKIHGLRSSFIMYVAVTFLLTAMLSGLAIWSCMAVQNALLPDSNMVNFTVERSIQNGTEESSTVETTTIPIPMDEELHEIPLLISYEDIIGKPNMKFAVKKIESSIATLSPKRKIVYQASQIGIVVIPVFLALTGILLCGLLFYHRKLKEPIKLLSSATEQIAAQNLDFQIVYSQPDEMGELCASFEQMRIILKENNKRMWDILEERQRLQGSVAHDLRNPIAIIQGHAQYLQLNLPSDRLTKEKTISVVDNILKASHRLERYTDSLRSFCRLEELEIQPTIVDFSVLSLDMQEDLTLLTEERNVELVWENFVNEKELKLDAKVLYRILENLVGNAIRFANEKITVHFSSEPNHLNVTVSDDGPGFSQKVLNCKYQFAYLCGDDETHLGIGLSICRVLCQKHGGQLTLANDSKSGAVVKITLQT